CDLPTWVVGRRQPPRKVKGRRAEERRIDAVVDVRRTRRHLTATVALRRSDGGEIAREHRGCRHERDVRRRALAKDRALVGGKEKKPIPDNRAAERTAELVALQPIVDALTVRADACKRARRVEPVMAQELEGIP